jgi:hypothetical protein
MNIIKKAPMIITLMTAIIVFSSMGNTVFAKESGRRHHGPPPEAYTACEGKSVGDTAEFESPHGDTLTGKCEEDGDRLVLRPDNPPGKGRKMNTDD